MTDSMTRAAAIRQSVRPGLVRRQVQRLWPGVLLCAVLAVLAYAIARWPQLNAVVPLSALTVGILLGAGIRLCVPLPAAVEPGIRWTMHWLLRAGIVLLGFRLVLGNLAAVGGAGLLLVLVGVVSTIGLALLLGRLLGLPDALSLLVGAGTGICGASAIVAVDAVIRAREQDVACAIALVTALGTVVMFGDPLIARATGMSEPVYAAWAGGSIHEVAQAVAAGFAFDHRAGVDVSLYKLSRVALLAPVCALIALWWRQRAGGDAASGRRRAPLPVFVLLFVAVVLLNSLVALPSAWRGHLDQLDSALLAAAMVATGLQTRLAAVLRLGWKPLLLVVVISVWLSGMALSGAIWIAG